MNTPTPAPAAGTVVDWAADRAHTIVTAWQNDEDCPIADLVNNVARALREARAAQPPASADTAEMRDLVEGMAYADYLTWTDKARATIRTAADALDAKDEQITKLTERCAAYEGQVKNAGQAASTKEGE